MSRGITLNCSMRSVLYSQQNLLAVGSGCLAGGADAGQRIANTAASVNLSGYTAIRIMSLMNKNVKKNQARRSHQEKEAAVDLSPEELRGRDTRSPDKSSGMGMFGSGKRFVTKSFAGTRPGRTRKLLLNRGRK